jgi:hypothetical protein
MRKHNWSRRGALRRMARNLGNNQASFFRRMALSFACRPWLLASTYSSPASANSFTSTHSRTFCQGRSNHYLPYSLLADLAARGPHQIEDLTTRSAHLFQHRFGPNPAIHDPYSSRPAIPPRPRCKCWSGHTAAPPTAPGTGPVTAPAVAETRLACAPQCDPNSIQTIVFGGYKVGLQQLPIAL